MIIKKKKAMYESEDYLDYLMRDNYEQVEYELDYNLVTELQVNRLCKRCFEEKMEYHDTVKVSDFMHSELGHCVLVQCRDCGSMDVWIVEESSFARDYSWMWDMIVS